MSTVEFTSDIVRATRFREKMRGYPAKEVDAFLERAATAIDLLQSRLAEATERAMRAEAALESNSETDESIRRTLTLAQRTAEMAVSEAKEDAERIRSEARHEADQARADALAESGRLREEAVIHAEDVRTEARMALEEAQARAAALAADAQAGADELERASSQRIDEAEQSSRRHIAERRQEAEAAIAEQAETARRELEASVASLSAQRAELRDHVEGLATYLADERSRVLGTLGSAIRSFEDHLSARPRPAVVEAAIAAEPTMSKSTSRQPYATQHDGRASQDERPQASDPAMTSGQQPAAAGGRAWTAISPSLVAGATTAEPTPMAEAATDDISAPGPIWFPEGPQPPVGQGGVEHSDREEEPGSGDLQPGSKPAQKATPRAALLGRRKR